MLQLRHTAFDLPFRYPFTTTKGTKTHQPILVTGLGLGPLMGVGEAPAITYYDVQVDAMQAALEKVRPMIERYALTDPKRFWHFLHHLLPGQNFLISALDMAGWDLFAQMRRVPLYRLLGIEWKPKITDYTLGKDTEEQMIEKLKAHSWPAYKIKISRPEDIDMVEALRRETAAPFRVDANEGLQYDDTLRLLPDLHKLGVEILEQPLHRDMKEEMKALKQQSPVPLIADESCREEKDMADCVESFHGINIKLTKCGGITPALRMMDEARKQNMKVMLGTMNESTIGTAALAHLSPLADYLDADGPLLLAEDIATGLNYKAGELHVSNAAGLGIRFSGRPYTNSFPD